MMRIFAQNLSVKRGEELIFTDVSFELSPTESLTISGPNGVGKSTLLRALAGLLPIDSGTFEIKTDSKEAKPNAEYCHYIGHKNAMKAELSVLENLNFWQRTMAQEDIVDDDLIMSPEAAVELLGLSHTLDLPFGFLSQGQRRRIALAKLFVSYRPVWLLDEPTAALDKASSDNFANITNSYLEKGGVVIAATHVPLGFKEVKQLEMTPPPLNEDIY
jgi:heme exporter protein A